jgi:hypothetical protein
MLRMQVALLISALLPVLAPSQTPRRVAIRAGKLIEGKSDKLLDTGKSTKPGPSEAYAILHTCVEAKSGSKR